jgi:Putative Actinobacterial Holin-X, holin superfamily III
MHTPGSRNADNRSVGEAVKQVADHTKALVNLELELASLELKRKLGALGLGIGLVVGAALFGLFALGFLFATAAAGFDLFLPLWLSLLVVAVLLLLLAAVLALLARNRIKQGTPPVPEQAIREAKLTTEVLKSNGA